MHNSQLQSGSADALKSGSAWTCHLNCTRNELRKARAELILAVVQRLRHTATAVKFLWRTTTLATDCSGSKNERIKRGKLEKKTKNISYKYTLHLTINSQTDHQQSITITALNNYFYGIIRRFPIALVCQNRPNTKATYLRRHLWAPALARARRVAYEP